MIQKIKCFFGFHKWFDKSGYWTVKDGITFDKERYMDLKICLHCRKEIDITNVYYKKAINYPKGYC